jgi:hypothetical protein
VRQGYSRTGGGQCAFEEFAAIGGFWHAGTVAR